jgi:precorrin-6A synthase
VIAAELPEGLCGGLLVWETPRSTTAPSRSSRACSIAEHWLEFQVIPGISSVQALAARHRITVTPAETCTSRGRQLTTRLANQISPIAHVDDIIVMLDPDLSCATLLRDQAIGDHHCC